MKASCILFIYSMLLFCPLAAQQEIVKLGEYGKVRVTYFLISTTMTEKAKHIASMGDIVDMNTYPDGQLAIKVEVLDLERKHTLYLGPQSLPSTLHGFTRVGGAKPSLTKDDKVTVKYNYNPNYLDETKAVLRATFYVKDKQGNIVGNKDGYYARGQRYTLRLAGASNTEAETADASQDSETTGDATPPSGKGAVDSEAVAWQVASKTNSITAYEAFLNAYPSGQYATKARQRLAALRPPPAPSKPKPSQSPSAGDVAYSPELENGSSSSKSEHSMHALSATYEIERSNGNLRIQIQGGQPPFELRFLEGRSYAGLINLGEGQDVRLTREQIVAAKIPPGSYQLKVYDKVGENHKAAICPEPYELPKASFRLPRWLMIIFVVGLVFYLGFYLGGKRGG